MPRQFLQGFQHHFFVDGVQKGKQERHGHGIDLGLLDQRRQGVNRLGRQIIYDRPGVVDPLGDPEPQLPGRQGGRTFQVEVV